MQNKSINIFENIDYTALVSQLSETIKGACEKFWEQDIKIYLHAVNNYKEIRQEKLIALTDFFTSQIKVENHKPIIARLSKEFINTILDASLQKTNSKFEFTKMTPLEVKILNGFCEFLYKRLNEILISPKKVKISEESGKYINFLFAIEPHNAQYSKIMISIPQDRINLTPLEKQNSFSDNDFLTSKATVTINAGSSKITFSELQNLAKDDIIILEDSELSKLTLISGKIKTKFNVKIDSSLILDIGNDDEEDEEENTQNTYEEVVMSKNVWDDIQIEINAEFEKVKMTIGELKQITQGQIVDLGSIFNNEISLYVEERKVAKGELLIINDRYAVRLNEVINSEAQKEEATQKPTAQPQSKPQAQAQPKTQPQATKPAPKTAQAAQPRPQPKPQQTKSDAEEFDYSDFEK